MRPDLPPPPPPTTHTHTHTHTQTEEKLHSLASVGSLNLFPRTRMQARSWHCYFVLLFSLIAHARGGGRSNGVHEGGRSDIPNRGGGCEGRAASNLPWTTDWEVLLHSSHLTYYGLRPAQGLPCGSAGDHSGPEPTHNANCNEAWAVAGEACHAACAVHPRFQRPSIRPLPKVRPPAFGFLASSPSGTGTGRQTCG